MADYIIHRKEECVCDPERLLCGICDGTGFVYVEVDLLDVLKRLTQPAFVSDGKPRNVHTVFSEHLAIQECD